MAEYLIQSENLVDIANKVRTLSGSQENMGLNVIKDNLDTTINNIQTEADLISQIILALENKFNKLITFTITNYGNFQAEKNMTWYDWANSDYNTYYFTCAVESDRVADADSYIVNNEGEFVLGSDLIISNYIYDTVFDDTPEV